MVYMPMFLKYVSRCDSFHIETKLLVWYLQRGRFSKEKNTKQFTQQLLFLNQGLTNAVLLNRSYTICLYSTVCAQFISMSVSVATKHEQ